MYLTVADIRKEFKRLHAGNITNSRGMLELQGISFIADEASIFGTPDYGYIAKELKWYKGQSLNVYDMYNPPKTWKDVATPYGEINSNYGYLIYSKENGEQFKNVVRTLRKRPDSKQASMIYIRPTMHKDAHRDGMKDFVCTNVVNYNLNTHTNSLDAIVQMRSNDVIYGYKNDLAWQKFVLEEVSKAVGIKAGKIIWQVASLHVYPKHFHLISSLFDD